MDFFRTWIIPPLVGGVIGWFTNWLAIKMLFRPLKEYRLFGLRLPFTPGILPRERSRLARSVGDTVARELLTPEVLRARISAPEVARELEKGIAARLEEAAKMDSGELLSLATRGTASGPLAGLLAGAWSSLVASPAFAAALSASLGSVLGSLHRVPLAAILPPEGARELASHLLVPANAERLKARLVGGIDRLYAGQFAAPPADSGGGLPAVRATEPSFASLLPPEALAPLVRALAEGIYRAAVPGVEGLLRGPALRRSMEREATDILHKAIGRLGTVQRLIVGVAGYERNLAETMPDTVGDLIMSISSLLRDPAMPGRAADAALEAFLELAGKPLARASAALVSREAARAAAAGFIDALRDHGPELAARAAALAGAGAGATIGGLMEALGLEAEELARRAAGSLAGMLSAAAAPAAPGAADPVGLGEAAARFAARLAEGLRGTSLGSLAGLEGERRAELAAWLAERALALVGAEAERILAGFDVAGMVVGRLEELDMADVERIILAVVDKELLWITVLGGVLGAAIGLVQSALMLLGGR